MKKAKIMLLTIGIVAVVGAALAFKAKTFGVAFCYTTETPGAIGQTIAGNAGEACPFFTRSKIDDAALPPAVLSYETVVQNPEDCTTVTECEAHILTTEGD